MKNRADLLSELLSPDRPVAQIVQDLAAFGWDSETELVTFTRRHMSEVLERFLSGSLPAETVHAWAEAIESRDDVGFEARSDEVLKQTIFELANPDITRPLTPLLAQKLIGDLKL